MNKLELEGLKGAGMSCVMLPALLHLDKYICGLCFTFFAFFHLYFSIIIKVAYQQTTAGVPVVIRILKLENPLSRV